MDGRAPHVPVLAEATVRLLVEEGLAIGWRPRYTNARIVRETARALAMNGAATV